MKVIAYHKENGNWISDGVMTIKQAQDHVIRCEYDSHGIEYKTEPVPVKKKTKRKVNASKSKETGVSKS